MRTLLLGCALTLLLVTTSEAAPVRYSLAK